MRRWILPIILASGACTTGTWKDFYGDRRSATIPADVRAFVIDAQGCNHFAGEEAYDAERAAFLKKNIDAMCPKLGQRNAKLMAKYRENAETTAIISEAWSAFK